jgi:DNA replication initiation complex subunit (GINS family)
MADKEIALTYENLYEILRSEKYKPELQKLENTFYKDILNYLKEKKSILNSQQKKDSIFAKSEIEKTKKQIKNISKIIRELYEKREIKIIQLGLLGSRTKPDGKVLSFFC